jgi:hypothetical protein
MTIDGYTLVGDRTRSRLVVDGACALTGARVAGSRLRGVCRRANARVLSASL